MNFNDMAKEVKKELETKCNFDFSLWTITYELNGRFKTRLGDCTRNRVDMTAHIRIHKGMFADGNYDEVRQTLVHELVHVIQCGRGHDSSFYMLADIVNSNTNYNVKRTGNNPSAVKSPDKYVIECMNCGNKSYRKIASKVVKHPSLYRCSKCNGKLEARAL